MSSKAKGSVKETTKVENLRILSSITDFNTTTSFDIGNSAVQTVPPVYKCALSLEAQENLKIYQQLYPNRTIKFFPIQCKQAIIGDELVSSVRYKDDHQAVIVAYWPSTGHSFTTIDYTWYKVDIIHYFIKHAVTFLNDDNTESLEEHLFCYIIWKQNHPNENWFGISAVLTSTLNEAEGVCCHRCASGMISVEFGLTSETVFATWICLC